eukprot:650449_1
MESVCLFGTAAVMVALIVIDTEHDYIYVSWYLTVLILGPFCIVCVIILNIIYKQCRVKRLDVTAKERLERRWVRSDIEMQLQPTRRLKTRLSIQQQIQHAESLPELMPFIEGIDIDNLKQILVAHYDAIETTTVTTTLNLRERDEAIETATVTRRAKDIIKMAVSEQEKLIKLYQTNRNVWRNKMTTTIRQHPDQFDNILEILNSNHTDEMNAQEFENALPALDKTLIECMFDDIGSFEGKCSEEEMLKLTTIARWMDYKSCVFKEIELVNDNHIIVSLCHELDKYLEYKSGNDGKGVAIERMKRNEYGKELDSKYEFNKTTADEQWWITSIGGETVSNKTENEINQILEQVNLTTGYHVAFQKRKKGNNDANKSGKCEVVEEESKLKKPKRKQLKNQNRDWTEIEHLLGDCND